MAIEIKAPNKVGDTDDIKLFLCGVIDMGRAAHWDKELIWLIEDKDCIVLNPRRDDWDSNWKQDKNNLKFREQVEWELDCMERSDIMVVALPRDSNVPISLMELGLHIGKRDLIVWCEEGYYCKGNVDIVCERYGVPVESNFLRFVARLRYSLDKLI